MKKQLIIITTKTLDGEFYMIADKHDIVRASGFGTVEQLILRLPQEIREGADVMHLATHPYQNHIMQYYDGDVSALDKIPREQSGTEFQAKVWQAISNIPYGQTISYRQLAEQSGNPAAVRAAGTICGLNRLCLLVPCHRVLRSDGSLGNYLYGTQIKQSLLEHEKQR